MEQISSGCKASRNLGLDVSVGFTSAGASYLYPWPQRPPVWSRSLCRTWPALETILDAYEEQVSTSANPSGRGHVFDGATFEMFLEAVGEHKSCAINYALRTSFYSSSTIWPSSTSITGIRAFHVKDAEFSERAAGRLFGTIRAGSTAPAASALGDGQVDFAGISSKLAQQT